MSELTGKQRVQKLFKREPLDTMPCFSGQGAVVVQAIDKMGTKFAKIHTDARLLAELGQRTYLQHFSAIWGVEKLQAYLLEHYSPDTISAQLADIQNHSFLIASVADRPVGFVKINWNRP